MSHAPQGTGPGSAEPGDDDIALDDEHVGRRADLLAEERTAGSEDPDGQAQAILEDSEERTFDRDAAPGTVVEHRRSEDTVGPD